MRMAQVVGNVVSTIKDRGYAGQKLMIVDSRYVVIGSSNFNFRSMSLSEELALVVDSPELAALLEKHADDIAEISHNISIEEAEKLREEEGSSLAYLFMLFGG